MTRGDFVFYNARRSLYPFHRKKQKSILALFWLLGFGLGSFFGWTSKDLFLLLLQQSTLVTTSKFRLLLLFSMSILLTIIGLLFRSRLIIYSVALAEGLAFGAVLIGFSFCNLECGWLLATALLVPKCLLLVPQYLFWRKCLIAPLSCSIGYFLAILVTFSAFVISFHQSCSTFVLLLLDQL